MAASTQKRAASLALSERLVARVQQGSTYDVVAAEMGVSKSRVWQAMRRLGLTEKHFIRALIGDLDLSTGTVGVPLNNGSVALIDEIDAEWVSAFNWHADISGYAVRTAGKGRKFLHRELMERRGLVAPMFDHVDGNRLDNRRANLRPCTAKENSRNGAKRSKIQPYKGVSREPAAPHLWRARICVDGKLLRVGVFDDAAEAARAYDAAAIRYFGEFARTNFADAPADAPAPRAQVLARGERVKGAKLTEDAVRDIRARHAQGVTIYRLAKSYGVEFGTVKSVVIGATWRHVAEAA